MRHLVGILLAIALTAALFFGVSWAVIHVTALAAHGHNLVTLTGTNLTGLLAAAVLAFSGLFLGILIAVPAVSPLATGLPGLGLLAYSALLAVSANRALRWLPMQSFAYGQGVRALLVSGVLAVLGAAMIVPLFMPSRWHSRATEPEGEDSMLPAPTGLLS